MVSRGNDRIAEAVRLLAAGVAVAADPTATSLLSAGADIHDSLRKLAAAPRPGVERLAAELAAAARACLVATGEAPPDAEVLYLQMVEAGLLTPAEIVACGMDASAVADAMLGKLTDHEHRRGPMQALFRNVTIPVLTRLLADNDLAADLTPAFLQGVLGHLAGPAEKLDRLDRLTRPEMEALAVRFEIEGVYALSDTDLRAELAKRAEDYRALTDEIETLKGLGLSLRKALPEVDAALDSLDLAAAERLLAEIRQSVRHRLRKPVTDNARIMQAQADLALLRGRVDEAFAILSAAADGFGCIDPDEPTHQRWTHAQRLRSHGMRYGGAGLALSARMLRHGHEAQLMRIGMRMPAEPGAASRVSDTRALAQSHVADGLRTMGNNLQGAAGAALLGEAAETYRAVLRVWTEGARPMEWASAQNNLGLALREQGSWTEGAAAVALFGEAVAACRAALRVRTEDTHAADWAETQNNLGLALRAQGSRVGGAAGVALLEAAVEAYRAALRIRTEDTPGLDWARTQNNLGTALEAQGRRIGGAPGAILLSRAVDAYRAALQVWTRENHAVDWAATQSNLGAALEAQGSRIGGEAGMALLGEAVEACRAALPVRTEEAHPVDWAMTQNNLGNALQALGSRTGGPAGEVLVGDAVEALHAALRVRTREAHPLDWAMTMENLGAAHEARADLAGGATAALETAAGFYEAALQVYDREHMPYDHGTASEALARVRGKLAGP